MPDDRSRQEPLPMPRWVMLRLRPLRCPKCDAGVPTADVVAMGLRRPPAGRPAFSLESKCGRCGEESLWLLPDAPFDPRVFAFGLVLARRRGRDGGSLAPADPSFFDAWTDHRAEAERATLDGCATHDEFLRAIGVTAEQYERWAIYHPPADGEEGKKNPDSEKE